MSSRHFATLLIPLSLTGCGLFTRHGLPDDPLFVSRAPLESKAVQAAPVAVAATEPAPPANPYHSVAFRPPPAPPPAPQRGD